MSITQAFQPPLYWQQFEDLTETVFPYVFGDPSPTKIGRPGQAQQGVDVYGTFQRTEESIGIQCKRMDEVDANGSPLPGGPITAKLLRAEYKKALAFNPALDHWILATTARRDAKIQEIARKLDAQSRNSGKFKVKLWFWDDYVTYLNCYDDLASYYYSSVINIGSPEDQDRVILELFQMALQRPAFVFPFPYEQREDFLAALRDTQRALATGELVDRETRHVIRKAVGGWQSIQNQEWRESCKLVFRNIQSLRLRVMQGLTDREITTANGMLDVRDDALRQELTELRQSCVDDLNATLEVAVLPGVG